MSKYDPALLEQAVRLARQADSYSHGVEAVFDSLERAPWWEEVEVGYALQTGEPYREESPNGTASELTTMYTYTVHVNDQNTFFRDTRWTPPPAPLAVGDVIETAEDLERLPVGAILTDPDGDAWQQPADLVFKCIYPAGSERSKDVVKYGPFTIRWLPEPEATE